MKKYILTIDQGTTSTRTIIFDEKANIVCMNQMELELISPQDGYIEHNPKEIWEKTYTTIANVLNQTGIKAKDIAGIAITNQRETTVLWDKVTGKTVYNAIVWQSRQSQEICDRLVKKGYQGLIQSKTGLIINSYFSASKVIWLFENVKGVKERSQNGELYMGTIDCFLLYKLTNGTVHATDYTNASRTMMYNIYDKCWDDELLGIYDIPKCILPEVKDCNSLFGYATALCDIDKDFKDVPIVSMIGDQQASLFGHCCFNEGDSKNTYGTGCFMLMNTKKPVKNPKYGLLSTIAWGIDGNVEYALEGSVFIGGAGIQWLRDEMDFFKESKDCEKSLKIKNPSQGVYLVPAFIGLGTPYWDAEVRGACFGLRRTTTKDHIIAATVEAIAYQSRDILEVMQEASGIRIKSLGVDGGASVNNYLMQFQADLLNCTLNRAVCKETTALGAAFIAGLKVGLYKDLEDVKRLHIIDTMFMPDITHEERHKKLDGWKQAVKSAITYKL